MLKLTAAQSHESVAGVYMSMLWKSTVSETDLPFGPPLSPKHLTEENNQ